MRKTAARCRRCLSDSARALSAEILEQVLVKVNGEIVTKTEFERIQIGALRELQNQPDPSRMTDAELSKALAQVTPQAIVTVIDEMLLLQRAKELGYAVTDAQFTQVLASIKKDNKLESDEQFESALKSEGLTLAQLKQMLSKRMLIGQVQQREIGSRIDITETEERAYYDAHPTEFETTPSVTLREILVNAEVDPVKKAPSVGALDDAKAKAEAIRARIVKGESFDKLAAELSDSPSKANGGLIGPISRDEMNEELLKMHLEDESRRDHSGYQHANRRSDLQARIVDRFDDAAVRSCAVPDRRQARAAEDRRRAEEIRPASPGPGHYRVEERRSSQGVGSRCFGRTDLLDLRSLDLRSTDLDP